MVRWASLKNKTNLPRLLRFAHAHKLDARIRSLGTAACVQTSNTYTTKLIPYTPLSRKFSAYGMDLPTISSEDLLKYLEDRLDESLGQLKGEAERYDCYTFITS